MIKCKQCERISNCPYGIQDCESIISTCDEFSFDILEHDKKIREDERNKVIDEFAEKIKEYSGSHFVDCDPYWGKPEMAFMTELFLDEIVEELKEDTK